jgi:hypothetical protein
LAKTINGKEKKALANGDEKSKFISLLERLDFDQKYYSFVASTKSRKPAANWDEGHWKAALDSFGEKYQVLRNEKLFRLESAEGSVRIQLLLAYSYGSLEPILSVLSPFKFSCPFPGLAFDIANRRIGKATPNPPYPKIRYENVLQLNEAIGFSLTLFRETIGVVRSMEE